MGDEGEVARAVLGGAVAALVESVEHGDGEAAVVAVALGNHFAVAGDSLGRAIERALVERIVSMPQDGSHIETGEGPNAGQQRTGEGVGGLFSNEDYPEEALRRNEQGSVQTRLKIGADGRVHDCKVVKSSGSASLDKATCNVLRARFRPAVNAQGQPTASEYVPGAITWRVEG
jgi:TonB family protein